MLESLLNSCRLSDLDPCKFWEILKNNFFPENIRATTSILFGNVIFTMRNMNWRKNWWQNYSFSYFLNAIWKCTTYSDCLNFIKAHLSTRLLNYSWICHRKLSKTWFWELSVVSLKFNMCNHFFWRFTIDNMPSWVEYKKNCRSELKRQPMKWLSL